MPSLDQYRREVLRFYPHAKAIQIPPYPGFFVETPLAHRLVVAGKVPTQTLGHGKDEETAWRKAAESLGYR